MNFIILSADEAKLIEKSIRFFRIVLCLYYFLPNFAVALWNIDALFANENVLVFSGWYPGFDWKNNDRDYWTIFIYQYVGITITGLCNVSIDSYFCFSTYLISAEFEILGNRLMAARDQNFKSAKANLVKHVTTYLEIRGSIENVQKNLALTYFSQVILSGIVIYSCLSVLAKVKNFNFIRYSYNNNANNLYWVDVTIGRTCHLYHQFSVNDDLSFANFLNVLLRPTSNNAKWITFDEILSEIT